MITDSRGNAVTSESFIEDFTSESSIAGYLGSFADDFTIEEIEDISSRVWAAVSTREAEIAKALLESDTYEFSETLGLTAAIDIAIQEVEASRN